VNQPISSEEPRAAVALVRALAPEPRLLVIRRAHNPKDPWSGHFSLPGGRREPEDPDLLATSIRETFEEVGLQLKPQDLIKPLPLALAGSSIGKITPVQPFLFEIEMAPSLVLMESEVASVHWVTETFVKSPMNHVRAPMLPHLPERQFPGIPLADYFIWGFTYGILRDYLGCFPHLD
jgi:8-oxo-dGTP pyrophosphatase MutT (NUDIX family)